MKTDPERRLSGSGVSLRACTQADLTAILAIEHACYPSPWKRAAFEREFHNQHGRFLVAEQAAEQVNGMHQTLVGYLCSWLIVDEIHILNIAVHPDHRQQGIGRALLDKTLTEGQHAGACSANLEVRRSNTAAIALYQQFGFQTVTTRHKYYQNGEDALLMVCCLDRSSRSLHSSSSRPHSAKSH